jgi:ATP-dependent protease ClpP protease subunit
MQSCDVRKMTLHSTMCIHNPSRNSVSLDTLENPKLLAKLIKELKDVQAAAIRGYVKRTKKKEAEIKKKLKEDRPMSATEALDYGLIDEII